MAKLEAMLVLTFGLSFLLLLGGVQTGSYLLFNELGLVTVIDGAPTITPQNFSLSNLTAVITGIFLAIALAGLIISLVARAPPTAFLMGSLAVTFIAIVADGINIITWTAGKYGNNDWVTLVVTGILGVWAIVFLMSVIDWWRGAS